MTTRPAHHCNADATNGPVCSHLVTDDQLTDWGHPVLVTGKVCGSTVVLVPGGERGRMVHAAWADGHVRSCPTPVAVDETWAECHSRLAS